MHRYDDVTEELARLVLAYISERLQLEPVSLDFSATPAELNTNAPSLISEHGRTPDEVFTQFRDVLALAVISCDSPRFLSFIPAAPTKAAPTPKVMIMIRSVLIPMRRAESMFWATARIEQPVSVFMMKRYRIPVMPKQMRKSHSSGRLTDIFPILAVAFE